VNRLQRGDLGDGIGAVVAETVERIRSEVPLGDQLRCPGKQRSIRSGRRIRIEAASSPAEAALARCFSAPAGPGPACPQRMKPPSSAQKMNTASTMPTIRAMEPKM
jgi:hypothetical protein